MVQGLTQSSKSEKLTPPAMPIDLSRVEHRMAIVGGGSSTVAFLRALTDFYCKFRNGCLSPLEGEEYAGLPIPPRISVTIFDPHDALGVGYAYRTGEPWCATNTVLRQFSIDGSTAQRIEAWNDSLPRPCSLDRPVSRKMVGSYFAWETEQLLNDIHAGEIPISITHVRDEIREVKYDSNAEGEQRVRIISSSGECLTGYHSAVIANGHSRNVSHYVPHHDSEVIRDIYAETEKFRQILRSKPEHLIICGCGDQFYDALQILRSSPFEGKLSVVSRTLSGVLLAIQNGMYADTTSSHIKYLQSLHHQGRLSVHEGTVTDVDSCFFGAPKVAILTPRNTTIYLKGVYINCATFEDGLDKHDVPFNPLLRGLYRQSALNIQRQGSQLSGTGHINPSMFAIGRAGFKDKYVQYLQMADHAKEAAFYSLQHAYFTAWTASLES